jgi:hypothetical protein
MYDFAAVTLRLQTTETPDRKNCVNRHRWPKQAAGHLQDGTRVCEEHRRGRVVNKNAGQQAELCRGSPIDSRYPACGAYGEQRGACETPDEYCINRSVI